MRNNAQHFKQHRHLFCHRCMLTEQRATKLLNSVYRKHKHFYHSLSISNSTTIEILAMGTSRVSPGPFPVFPLPLTGARPASSPKLDAAGNLLSETFEDNAFQVCVARTPNSCALSLKPYTLERLTHTNTHTHTSTNPHTLTPAHVHKHTHTHTHTDTDTRTRTHTHEYQAVHTYIHTSYIHTYIHTHTHTHTHMHT